MNYISIMTDVAVKPIIERSFGSSFQCRALGCGLSLERRQAWLMTHPNIDQRASWEDAQAEKVESNRRTQDFGLEVRYDPQASLEQWCYILRAINFELTVAGSLAFMRSVSEIRQKEEEICLLVNEQLLAHKSPTKAQRKDAREKVLARLQAQVDQQRSDWVEFGDGALARVVDEYQSGTCTEEPADLDTICYEQAWKVIANLTQKGYAQNLGKRTIIRSAFSLA